MEKTKIRKHVKFIGQVIGLYDYAYYIVKCISFAIMHTENNYRKLVKFHAI